MGNPQLATRRVFVTLSGTALATTSGCLGLLGIGSEPESGEDSNSGSASGDSTINGSNTSDDLPEPGSNSSEHAPSADKTNETNEAESEENEAAVPESNPQNDPSQTEAADPNTTEPPTSDDIELLESNFSTSANEATITVRNTSDQQMNSIDLWVIFYNNSGQQVDEGMNGATGVNPDQIVTITIPSEASDATTFEIQRVMVST